MAIPILGLLTKAFGLADRLAEGKIKANEFKAAVAQDLIQAMSRWNPLSIVGLMVGTVTAFHLAWLAFLADMMGKVAIFRGPVFSVEVGLLVLIFGGQFEAFIKTAEAVNKLFKKR